MSVQRRGAVERTARPDGELTEAELTTLLKRLKRDAALRDEVSAQQLTRGGLAGLRALDAGYTLRILAAVRQPQPRKD